MSDERRTDMATCETEETVRVIEGALLSLWQTANELSRIRPPRDRYRVCIFGSARSKPGEPIYREVAELAARLTTLGCDIVTGGGPGLMQAANEGAHQADPKGQTESVGVRIDLPFEQGSNPFVETIYTHRTFFSRLHQFVRMSNAFVVMRGGIGSTLETLLVWQLLQVRHLHDVPLILVGPMWKGLVDWAPRQHDRRSARARERRRRGNPELRHQRRRGLRSARAEHPVVPGQSQRASSPLRGRLGGRPGIAPRASIAPRGRGRATGWGRRGGVAPIDASRYSRCP